MENKAAPYGRDEPGDYGDSGQWPDNIRLLRLVQKDYQGARMQLEQVSHALAEREAQVSQRLQHALWVSGGYHALCLIPYEAGSAASRIGKTTLGEVTGPTTTIKAASLEVRCLGRFEVRSAWRQVERWHSVKAKSVFQYVMARHRDPVIKDMLMETLWPDCSPRTASNNLKAAMHGLRRTLSQLLQEKEDFPYILFVQGSYLINPDIELWVDVEEFEQHWAQGRRLEKEGKLHDAVREFEMAEALYRGDYLEDEPYEDWTLLRREALKDTYLSILGKLANHYMEITDHESCIIYCQKIMARDPCREDAYRQLMRCYSRLGRRNRALRWYEICRRTIQTELDTDPDHETTALYQQLLKNEPI